MPSDDCGRGSSDYREGYDSARRQAQRDLAAVLNGMHSGSTPAELRVMDNIAKRMGLVREETVTYRAG